MGIYLTNKKKSVSGPKFLPMAGICKRPPKIMKIRDVFDKSKISENSPGPDKNCSSSVFFRANDLKSFSFGPCKHIYFTSIAHNWILSLILGIQFWFKVKKSKFRDTQIFQRTNFASPWTGPYKFFGPETFFVMSHMSQLKFWYLMTAISCLDSGDFTRWRALKVNLPPPRLK